MLPYYIYAILDLIIPLRSEHVVCQHAEGSDNNTGPDQTPHRYDICGTSQKNVGEQNKDDGEQISH
jgi:hypothetical protein